MNLCYCLKKKMLVGGRFMAENRRVLMVATVPSMIGCFNMDNIRILLDMGYEVHVACNFKDKSVWSKQDVHTLVSKLKKESVKCHQISFGRNPFSLENIKSERQIKRLLSLYRFDIVHCHTPVASAITRIAAIKSRDAGTAVIYTCHGFHFHKKAPIKNWVFYYPIERFLARFTDMIIAINKEDYSVIKRFRTNAVKYIPGVGVDTALIRNLECDEKKIRDEIGVPHDAFVILTIGELSERKNQSVIIDAISRIKDNDIYYVICGSGAKEEEYKKFAKEKGIAQHVIFMGQREHKWVMRLSHAVDLGAVPSLIEGLGLAGIEIMAAGKPLIGSNIHGIKDYLIDGETGISCNPKDVQQFKFAIEEFKHNKELYEKCKKNAPCIAARFDIKLSRRRMRLYYEEAEKSAGGK